MKLGRIMFAPDGAAAGSGTSTPPPASTSILNTPPAASLKFNELVGEDGGLNEKWTDILPDDLKNEACFKTVKTFPALAKSFRDAQKMIGSEKVALPGKNSTKEEREAFFNKIGRPERPDEYKFEAPKDLPPQIKIDDNQLKAFANKAHEMGLTQTQFVDLLNYHNSTLVQGLQAMEQGKIQSQKEALTELQKDWGGAFNQELEKARRAAATFGSLEDFESMGVADNPKFLKFLAKIGGTISEDRMRGHDSMMIPVDAVAKIKEIQGDKTHPYNVKDHPAHKNAVAEMEKLFAQAYPEPKK